MSTFLQKIEAEVGVLSADIEAFFIAYILPLAKQLATDESVLLVQTLEADVASMQGSFTVAKLAALVPDIIATMATKGLTIAETDILAASAALLAKISAIQAAGAATTGTTA